MVYPVIRPMKNPPPTVPANGARSTDQGTRCPPEVEKPVLILHI